MFCTHSYSRFHASQHKFELFKSIKSAIKRNLYLMALMTSVAFHFWIWKKTLDRKCVYIRLTTELTRIQVNYKVIDRSGHLYYSRWVCVCANFFMHSTKWKIDTKTIYLSRCFRCEITLAQLGTLWALCAVHICHRYIYCIVYACNKIIFEIKRIKSSQMCQLTTMSMKKCIKLMRFTQL